MRAIERQPDLFDYDSLTPTTREIVQRRTGEIHTLMRRTAADIVDIGLKLTEVKGILGHGNFGVWLGGEFGWSYETANKFVQVAGAFKSVNFTDLDVAPSALYVLAAPNTPEVLRQEMVEEAQAGRKVTHKAAKERLTAHRQQFQPPPPAERPRPIVTIDAEPQPPAPEYPPYDPDTGEFLPVAQAEPAPLPVPDHDSAELQALIKPDEQHVITPETDYERAKREGGWDEAKRLESVIDRCIQSLTALKTYTREQLQEVADSPAGGDLLTAHRLGRVQQLCADFLRLSDYDAKTVDAN